MFNWKKIIIITTLIILVQPITSATAIISPDRPVYNNEALWTARLTVVDPYDNNRFTLCTGVLVAPLLVITAAHCIDPDNGINMYKTLEITLGAHNIHDPNMIVRKPVSLVYHTKYFRDNSNNIYENVNDETPGFDSDIALITLDKPVTKIKPVKLPSKNYKSKGSLRTYGWGMINDYGDMSEDLLTANQNDYSYDMDTLINYQQFYNYDFTKVIAATAYKNELATGTCYGDSGGPLVDKNNVLLGITSWANTADCFVPVATIFTKISEYRDWIIEASAKAEKLRKTNFCDTAIRGFAKSEAEEFIDEVNALATLNTYYNGNINTDKDLVIFAQNTVKEFAIGSKYENGKYISSYGVVYKINFKKGKMILGVIMKDMPIIKNIKKKSKLFITGYEKAIRKVKTNTKSMPLYYTTTVCADPKDDKPKNKARTVDTQENQNVYTNQLSYSQANAFVKEIIILAAFTIDEDAVDQASAALEYLGVGSFELLTPFHGVFTSSNNDRYGISFVGDWAYLILPSNLDAVGGPVENENNESNNTETGYENLKILNLYTPENITTCYLEPWATEPKIYK